MSQHWATGLMSDLDTGDENTRLGANLKKLSGGKKMGGALGGLLLPLILSVATGGAASPLLLAAMGGLGAAGGSMLGGKFSGVKGDDITGGRFFKNTRNQLMDDMGSQQMKDSIMGAVSGYTGASSFNKAGAGIANFGKDFGQYGMGALKTVGKGGVHGLADKLKGVSVAESLKGGPSISDLVKNIESARGVGEVSKMGGGGGLLDMIKGGYGGLDKKIGGILPGGSKFGGLPKAFDATTLRPQGFGGAEEGGSGIDTNLLNLFKNKRPNQGGYGGGVDLQSVLGSGPEGMTSLEDVNTGFEDWLSRGSEGLPSDLGLPKDTGGLSNVQTPELNLPSIDTAQDSGYDASPIPQLDPQQLELNKADFMKGQDELEFMAQDVDYSNMSGYDEFMQGQDDLGFMAQDIDTSNLTPEGGFKQPYVPSEADGQQEYQDFLNQGAQDDSWANLDRLQNEYAGGPSRQNFMSPDRMNAIEDSMGYYEDQWQNPNAMVGIPNAESSPIMNPNDNQTVWDKASMGLGEWWNQDSQLDPEVEAQLNQNQGQYGLLNPFNWNRSTER